MKFVRIVAHVLGCVISGIPLGFWGTLLGLSLFGPRSDIGMAAAAFAAAGMVAGGVIGFIGGLVIALKAPRERAWRWTVGALVLAAFATSIGFAVAR